MEMRLSSPPLFEGPTTPTEHTQTQTKGEERPLFSLTRRDDSMDRRAMTKVAISWKKLAGSLTEERIRES